VVHVHVHVERLPGCRERPGAGGCVQHPRAVGADVAGGAETSRKIAWASAAIRPVAVTRSAATGSASGLFMCEAGVLEALVAGGDEPAAAISEAGPPEFIRSIQKPGRLSSRSSRA
jgi:hypothetical protein